MSNEELNEKLDALKNAASQMLFTGTAMFQQGRPEEYAQMKAEFDAGQVEFGLTVRLMPEMVVECWAASADGARQVFATVKGREARRTLN